MPQTLKPVNLGPPLTPTPLRGHGEAEPEATDCRVQRSPRRAEGRFLAHALGLRLQEFRLQSLGFKVLGLGFRALA